MANSGFQTQVYYQPAPAIQGDFASTNPRAVVLAGPGGLVAGPAGVTVGNFCWIVQGNDPDGGPAVVNSFGAGNVSGFVHREQQALITSYLQTSSMVVPAGFPITVMDQGDFWILNSGSGQALPGQKAFANFADGTVSFAAAGATQATGGTSTTSTIAAGTSSFTGSITGSIMTVTAVSSGSIYPGTAISGTNVVSGSLVVAQLSGTALGVGTYSVSIPEQSVASTTISGTYGLFTVSGTVAGFYGVGDTLTGGSVTAGTTITALGTGTGGAGTYIVNPTQSRSSAAINVLASNIETKWYATSSALTGELVKITSWVGAQG